MEKNPLCIATAELHFSDLYWFEHRCFYAFDIDFKESTSIFCPNLAYIPAGYDEERAEDFLKTVKHYFTTAGIHDGDSVAVLFSDTQVLAIGALGNELWIDVHEGIFPHVPPKDFSKLGLDTKSLKVY